MVQIGGIKQGEEILIRISFSNHYCNPFVNIIYISVCMGVKVCVVVVYVINFLLNMHTKSNYHVQTQQRLQVQLKIQIYTYNTIKNTKTTAVRTSSVEYFNISYRIFN